ncbi:ATP-binding cassette domain-containing protein [Vagococcus intermedius]|uniref:ATP-binding cassette domain-containing protein n=1 Tax=Vagococcus intermedius TaxID=2991418 RepID=A0AAF0I5P0_9ENTE|nr:ATP-binding cassette domain-containing protein [Vagococcus intermedius]WEG73093.1 ATP-binding cassette domain-containing protein [Vagococcus intermedius]WEG75177.1 ATP-binding cassette domain-containing protein [Vagococcus intermedius]
MMTLRNIGLQERKTGRQLVRGLNLTINPGDKLAIIGEEGNGKSTLLRVMRGKEYLPDFVELTGDVITDTTKIGYLAQQAATDEQLTIADLFHDVDWNETFLKALKEFEIDTIFSEQKLQTLSGGEKIRYQLLALLASSPEMILLDEPTNDVDLQAINWLERFIKTTSIPVIYVSHDEHFIEQTATRLLHLELAGRKDQPIHTLDNQGYDSYRQRRASRIAKEQHETLAQRKVLHQKEEKLQRVWNKAEHQHQNVNRADPRLQKKVASLKNQRTRLEKEQAGVSDIKAYEKESFFSFAYLDKAIVGKKIATIDLPVLENKKGKLAGAIHLPVLLGDKIVITGNNGCGKTTLLKEIYQQLGDKKVGYMPQNYGEVLDLDQSASQFLTRQGDADEKTKIFTMLGNVNFTREEMQIPMEELSGGQQAKILLLSLILDEAECLILDEPTRNLSPITNPLLYQELTNFKGTIISVSHDRKYIKEIGTKIYQLNKTGLIEL